MRIGDACSCNHLIATVKIMALSVVIVYYQTRKITTMVSGLPLIITCDIYVTGGIIKLNTNEMK